MTTTRIDLTLAGGGRIAATCHHADHADTTAIILHGFYSSRHSPNVRAAIGSFAAQGVSVLAPDLYGRGDSAGAFGDLTITRGVATAAACIAHVYSIAPQSKIVLTGGSFGGLVALHAAAKYADAVDLLVLRAPVSDWHAVWLQDIGTQSLADWAETGLYQGTLPSGEIVTFGRDFYDELQTDVYAGIAPYITCPTLIVHGDADEIVPVAQSQRLHDSLPDSELVILPGADHAFSDPAHAQDYRNILMDFVRKKGSGK